MPPWPSASTHHVGGGVEQLAQLRAGQRRREPRAVDLGPPQRLVGVDVADARYHRLVQQLALDLRVLAPQHRNDAIAIELRVERIAGQMRDGHRHVGAVDRHQIGEHPATERALVDEAQRGAVVEQRRNAQVIRRSAPSPSNICPLIPRCTTRATLPSALRPRGSSPSLAGVQRQPQILTAPAGAGDPRIEQPCGQVGGTRFVTTHRPRVVHPHGADGSTRHVGRQSAPDDLDFGQLRHCPAAPSTRRRRPSARPPSSSGRRPCRTRRR